MLTTREVESFVADGFVAIRGAVPWDVIAACQEVVWAEYAEDGNMRVNYHSRARGLLALYLLSDVDEASAPTRLRPGSHLDAARVLAPPGDAGMAWLAAAQAAAAATEHLPAVLATGRAGDVFLCHPFLVHAATWPHRGSRPRMVAQPGVALHGQFPLAAPLSPVERAIAAGGQSQSAAGS